MNEITDTKTVVQRRLLTIVQDELVTTNQTFARILDRNFLKYAIEKITRRNKSSWKNIIEKVAGFQEKLNHLAIECHKIDSKFKSAPYPMKRFEAALSEIRRKIAFIRMESFQLPVELTREFPWENVMTSDNGFATEISPSINASAVSRRFETTLLSPRMISLRQSISSSTPLATPSKKKPTFIQRSPLFQAISAQKQSPNMKTKIEPLIFDDFVLESPVKIRKLSTHLEEEPNFCAKPLGNLRETSVVFYKNEELEETVELQKNSIQNLDDECMKADSMNETDDSMDDILGIKQIIIKNPPKPPRLIRPKLDQVTEELEEDDNNSTVGETINESAIHLNNTRFTVTPHQLPSVFTTSIIRTEEGFCRLIDHFAKVVSEQVSNGDISRHFTPDLLTFTLELEKMETLQEETRQFVELVYEAALDEAKRSMFRALNFERLSFVVKRALLIFTPHSPEVKYRTRKYDLGSVEGKIALPSGLKPEEKLAHMVFRQILVEDEQKSTLNRPIFL